MIVAAAGGLVVSATAHAEATAKEMLAQIESNEGHVLATAFIAGNANGLSWANTELRDRGLKPLYCQPPTLSITPDQDVQIMRDHIRRYPKLADFPAGVVMMIALQATFPCKGLTSSSNRN